MSTLKNKDHRRFAHFALDKVWVLIVGVQPRNQGSSILATQIKTSHLNRDTSVVQGLRFFKAKHYLFGGGLCLQNRVGMSNKLPPFDCLLKNPQLCNQARLLS